MDFNLIVTTGTKVISQAECEIWFNLLAAGDENPIIIPSKVKGVMLIKTSIDAHEFISFLHKRESFEQKQYFHFLLKALPVDQVVAADIDIIIENVIQMYKTSRFVGDSESSFRIEIKTRMNKQIDTKQLIIQIASHISNPVSLKKWDWAIYVNIIGETAAISILRSKNRDLFRLSEYAEN